MVVHGQVNVLLVMIGNAWDGVARLKARTILRDVEHVLGDRLGRVRLVARLNGLSSGLYVNGQELEVSSPLQLADPRSWLRDSDLMLVAKNDTWDERDSALEEMGWTAWLELAHLMGKRIVAYGHEVAELGSSRRRLLRRLISQAGLVTVNCPNDIQYLKSYGVTNELFCTADSSYLVAPPDPAFRDQVLARFRLDPQARPLIAILPKSVFGGRDRREKNGKLGLRPLWSAVGATPERLLHRLRYVRQMAAYADGLVERYDANVVLMTLRFTDDVAARKIHESMRARHRARLVTISDNGLDDILALVSAAGLVVAGRVHAAVLACVNGVPMIGVSNDPRLENCFREARMSPYFLDYLSPDGRTPNTYKLDEWLTERTETALADRDELRERVRRAHASYRRRALENRHYLGDFIERYLGEPTSADETDDPRPAHA